MRNGSNFAKIDGGVDRRGGQVPTGYLLTVACLGRGLAPNDLY
jgi:hypothetical protein